jgi:polyhydroxybutyrate depolymerase
VSAIIFHGKRDRLIPYEGGRSSSRSGLYFLSVNDAVEFWIHNNRCSKEPKKDVVAEGVIRTQYSGCESDSNVVLYTLENGGHAWPGGHIHLSGDEPNRMISATDFMWDFFKAHPKKGR